ncbi:hypothetical protein BC826DRAFT_992332 [Russula brevipes]|nr:hypothetical protein BC826DRAFT_992332 [Russula brevipes]
MSDVRMELDDVDQAGNDTPPPSENKPSGRPKGKTATKATAAPVRESGKSLLPISRVQKIMKADKELPTVAKEAAFLISLATEEFIKRLSEASHHIAHREKRYWYDAPLKYSPTWLTKPHTTSLQIIPWPDTSEAPARRKLQGPVKSTGASTGGNRSMSDFVTSDVGLEKKSRGVDIVMNEDGTMQVAAGEGDSEDV